MAVKTFTSERLTSSDVNTYLTNSGLIWITETTVTGASAIQINNCFTSTYRDYFWTFNGTSSNTGAGDILAELCTGGTPNTTTNYYALLLYGASTFAWAHYYGATQPYLQMFYGANNRASGNGYIYSPQETKITAGRSCGAGYGSGSPVFGSLTSDWVFNGTTQFDGIRFYRASATLTGTLTIFGIRKQ